MMSTSDRRLMEVEKLGFQYGEASKLSAADVAVERAAAVVAAAGVDDVVAVAAGVVVGKVDAGDCLGGETSMMPEWEATKHTSRLVCMLEHQMKQSLLECQKKG